ncbi:MAG: MFS transporter, partial [Planctomycetes bacterium]|nr:MFS transporter [Planctomycetota bacterium]
GLAAVFLYRAFPHGAPGTTTDPASEQAASEETKPVVAIRNPWRDARYLAALVALGLAVAVFFQCDSVLPLLITEDYGLPERWVGRMFALNTLIIIVVEMLLVELVSRRSPLRVVGVGALATGLGVFIFGRGEGIPAIVYGTVMVTLGEMLVFPLFASWAATRADSASRGRYMGLMGATYAIAFAISPKVWMEMSETISSRAPYDAGLVLGALAAVIFIAVSWGKPQSVGP